MSNLLPFSLCRLTPSNTLNLLHQSFFCGKPTWNMDSDVPDLSGKVIIVTGGNAGIGRLTVKVGVASIVVVHLAGISLGLIATLYMASRNTQKAEAVIQELHALTGKRAIFLQLDLADLVSVKRAAQEFLSKEKELHVLYNNGGIFAPPIEEVASTGYDSIDLTFASNTLGHFYLTKLLLPTLIQTSHIADPARIVTMTSVLHYIATIDYGTFKDGQMRRKRTPFDLYSQSKWANGVLAMELARRYGDQGIVSMSVNPGNVTTEIADHATGFVALLAKMFLIHPPVWGAVTQLWAGTSAEATHLNGKYIAPWGKVAKHRCDVDDPEKGKELWEWLEEQVSYLAATPVTVV
ncbi:NAD(P)-binding protein [Mycena metata]|uniref:NAD(P)-binding protein n=1 Tax=Mycena metata TaxID=1033252 RepID=A0AAD7J6Y0_9AGAR|nr:NAD(P)-binding protein [Mycena metata]